MRNPVLTVVVWALLVLPAMSRLVLGLTEGRHPKPIDAPAPEPVPAE